MLTGQPPSVHGVVANGFFHRDRRAVEFWVGHNDVITAESVWSALRRSPKGYTSAVWHAQNIKGAQADYIVTPSPIHMPDGTTKLWCYSKPDDLYPQLLDVCGHFPLQHYWGPLSNIESTQWILRAALWLFQEKTPQLNWIYIPHLDYASQKFGANSAQASQSLEELDGALANFTSNIAAAAGGENVVFLVAGEYAITDVEGAVYPNRRLRDAGLLRVSCEDGRENLDLRASRAFAMVDHQFAHVYLDDTLTKKERQTTMQRAAEVLQRLPGVAEVYVGEQRSRLGMNHPRSGDIIIVCDDAHWLAYYWWYDDALAPPFARTVDIHRKPGYDPVELFFDPTTPGIPLDASLVKGSHGVPAVEARHRTALICSAPSSEVVPGRIYRDTDMQGITLRLLGAE